MRSLKKLAPFVIALLIVLNACSTNIPDNATARPSTDGENTVPNTVETPPSASVPDFDHIITIYFENHDYGEVIGNNEMPYFNRMARENVLFTQFYGVAHPSLPSYLAIISGDTFGIKKTCQDCFFDKATLPDLIEASGRTWKGYFEGIPSPCFIGSEGKYVQRHNPFIYFDPIRKDSRRCERSVISLDELDKDLEKGTLPSFVFIMPDLCSGGHDCGLNVSDGWLQDVMGKLLSSSALGDNYLILVAFEESDNDNSSCCGLPEKAGGRVAAFLVSPQATVPMEDDTPYSHYSFLKTIMAAWDLPDLGFTSNPATLPITAPWK